MISRLKLIMYFLLLHLSILLCSPVGYANEIIAVDFQPLLQGQFEISLTFSGLPREPEAYQIATPAHLVLDFKDVQSALDKKRYFLPFENGQDLIVISHGDNTRLIVNLLAAAPFETRAEGHMLILRIGIKASQRASVAGSTTSSLMAIDFHRDYQAAGVITIDLSDASINVDVNRIGKNIRLEFYQTALPDVLDRRLDVADFATPVSVIDSIQEGSSTVISIEADGQYDYLAYQTGNQYLVRIKLASDIELDAQKKKFDFIGRPLSLNFQNINVRAVLQIIADFTSLNLVASDGVTGSITLRLDKVPWDQALDIVLKTHGLDKRLEGNVLMIAPAQEIAEHERQRVEANMQVQELAPLETVFIRIKYADAIDIFDLFTRDDESGVALLGSRDVKTGNRIHSQQGGVVVDKRTNTIIVTDTGKNIAAFKRLVDEIDVPIRQVLIEARIVIANTGFKKELGATWGLAGIDKLSGGTVTSPFSDKTLGFSGRRSGLTPGAGVVDSFTYSPDEIQPDESASGDDPAATYTRNYTFDLADSLAVDLGVVNPTGSFSLGYLTDNFLIDLELSALELDGYGEIVSQPKVLTGDKQQATIKSGTEIAYQKQTSSGATSVEFKEAVLQLQVTPQITPDNRIIMDLLVSQDSIGSIISGGEPSIDVTQIETQVLVGNGQTLVLGGIFHTEEFRGTEKVPLLGDIPFLGRLFRNDLRNVEKREILIFITPKIIEDALLNR
ncbi:MAG: type IV pilus secretin PilQ family protein [Porticoccaceae bacterium]